MSYLILYEYHRISDLYSLLPYIPIFPFFLILFNPPPPLYTLLKQEQRRQTLTENSGKEWFLHTLPNREIQNNMSEKIVFEVISNSSK